MKQSYLDYALEQLKTTLSIPSPTGFTARVADYLVSELEKLGYQPKRTVKGGVLVDLGGEDREDGLLLMSHLDTLGGMVAEIKGDGRIRVTNIGGLRPNNVEGENVQIHTRSGKVYSGTMQLINASTHVNRQYGDTQRTFDTMEVVIDEKTASKEETKALGIEVGDFICYDPRTVFTPSGYLKSRFLDDKLCVAILLAFAKYLKEESLTPKRRLYYHFTVFEEVGHGGAGPVPEGVTEALAVDMGCVGEGLDCDETMVSICAKDSRGPSSYDVVSGLIEACLEKDVAYDVGIYNSYFSDADIVVEAGCDVRHGAFGPGVYASHGYERSHVDSLAGTFDLLDGYIKKA